MKGADVVFSSKRDDWETPAWLFKALDREFNFYLDAAASTENRKVPRWLGPGSPIREDALSTAWADHDKRIWCNPPYSLKDAFVAKAVEAQAAGATVVMLLPSRTDTKWWHRYVWDQQGNRLRPGIEVRYIKGRVKFVGGPSGAPFPSVVIVFRPLIPLVKEAA